MKLYAYCLIFQTTRMAKIIPSSQPLHPKIQSTVYNCYCVIIVYGCTTVNMLDTAGDRCCFFYCIGTNAQQVSCSYYRSSLLSPKHKPYCFGVFLLRSLAPRHRFDPPTQKYPIFKVKIQEKLVPFSDLR